MITKYGVILGYTIFFIILNLLIVGLYGSLINSPFTLVAPPVCTLGFIVIDGLANCFFNYLGFFFNLFTINSTIAIVETIFVIPFVLMLAVIVLEWIRGV